MGNPVVHFEIGGKDVKSMNSFYSSVFDWQISQLVDQLYIADPGSNEGIEGHLFQISDELDIPNLVILYVQVDDIGGCLEKVESLGGKILKQPKEILGNASHFAMFCDPCGNRIGLLQRRLSKQ